MNEYLHPNGQTYTEDQLNTAAKKQSITLDEYIRKSKVKLVEKKEKAVEKKSAASSTRVNPWDEKPVNPADAVVGPKKKVSAPIKEEPQSATKRKIAIKPDAMDLARINSIPYKDSPERKITNAQEYIDNVDMARIDSQVASEIDKNEWTDYLREGVKQTAGAIWNSTLQLAATPLRMANEQGAGIDVDKMVENYSIDTKERDKLGEKINKLKKLPQNKNLSATELKAVSIQSLKDDKIEEEKNRRATDLARAVNNHDNEEYIRVVAMHDEKEIDSQLAGVITRISLKKKEIDELKNYTGADKEEKRVALSAQYDNLLNQSNKLSSNLKSAQTTARIFGMNHDPLGGPLRTFISVPEGWIGGGIKLLGEVAPTKYKNSFSIFGDQILTARDKMMENVPQTSLENIADSDDPVTEFSRYAVQTLAGVGPYAIGLGGKVATTLVGKILPYLMVGSAAGTKLHEMEQEEAADKTIDYSNEQRVGAAVSAVGAEYLTLFGFQRMLGSMNPTMSQIARDEAASAKIFAESKNYFSTVLEKTKGIRKELIATSKTGTVMGASAAVKILSDEVILGKKIDDKAAKIWEAFADGAAMHGIIAVAPGAGKYMLDKFSSPDNVSKFKNNLISIAELNAKLEFGSEGLTEKDIVVLKMKKRDLEKENDDLLTQDLNAYGALTSNQRKTILEIEKSKSGILEDLSDVKSPESNLSKEDKAAAIVDLKSKYDKLDNDKRSILEKNKKWLLPNYLSDKNRDEIFDLMDERQQIKDDLKDGKVVDKNTANERLKEIDNLIEVKYRADKDIENVHLANRSLGYQADVIETNTEAEYEQELAKEGLSSKDNKTYGKYISATDNKPARLILNKDLINKNFRYTTGQHEFLHLFLDHALGTDLATRARLGKMLYEHAKNSMTPEEFNKTRVGQAIPLYESDFNKIKADAEAKIKELDPQADAELIAEQENRIKQAEANTYEEVFTHVSESLTTNDIQLKGSEINQFKKLINGVFKKAGVPGMQFETAEQVVDFIKDYNKNFKNGEFKGDIRELGKANEEVSYKSSRSMSSIVGGKTVQERIDELEDRLAEDEIDYDTYEREMKKLEAEEERLAKGEIASEPVQVKKGEPVKENKKEKAKKEITPEEETRIVIAENKSKVASEKVQEIYNKKGKEGAAEIIKLFKPIVSKIVDKRRDAPGFEEELLTDEINTGKGGLLDLILAYNPKDGVPLAAYINKYLPVRAITASRRVLDNQFNKDVTEQKDLMASETADQGTNPSLPEKQKYTTILESNILDKETLVTIKDKVLRDIRILPSKIDEPMSINRTVAPVIKDIMESAGTQIDIDVKKFLGGVAEGQLKRNLLKIKKTVLENMTTTWLMAKDNGKEVLGGIPQAIQKRVDGKWLSYPDWVGKAVDRESTNTDLAGRTAGHLLVRRVKNPNNFVTNEEYLAQFIGPDGKVLRGRKESISKAIAEELALELVSKDLAEDGPIAQAFRDNQERKGVAILDVLEPKFNTLIERGNVKDAKFVSEALKDIRDLFQKEQMLSAAKFVMQVTGKNLKDGQAIFNSQLKLMAQSRNILDKLQNIASSAGDLNGSALINQLDKIVDIKKWQLYEAWSSYIINNKDIIGDLKNTDGITLVPITKTLNRLNRFTDTTFKLNNRTVNVEVKSDFKAPLGSISAKISADGIKPGYGSAWNPKVADMMTLFKPALIGENGFITKLINDKKIRIENGKVKLEPNVDASSEGIGLTSKVISVKVPWTFCNDHYSKKNNGAGAGYFLIDNKAFGLNQDTSINGEKSEVIPNLKDLLPKTDFGNGEEPYVNADLRWFKNKSGGYDARVSYVMPEIISNENGGNFNSKDKAISVFKEMSKIGNYFGNIEEANNRLKNNSAKVKRASTIAKAIEKANEEREKGVVNKMRVFDLDDTSILSKSNVLYEMPDGTTGKLTGAEYADHGADLALEGARFDFSEFTKIIEGKKGPLFNTLKTILEKTKGDVYILTARPAEAAPNIHAFLDGMGVHMPIENITGLGSSDPQAKADWITEKIADKGYNDIFFADDASANVKAVRNTLDKYGVQHRAQEVKREVVDKKQISSLQEEIEANYNAKPVFGNKNNDVRTSLFNYDSPIAQKTAANGVDLRITEGLIRDQNKTYLLYADGKPVAEFKSVNDAKNAVKFIEDNLVKPTGIQENTGPIAKDSKALDKEFNRMISRDKGISPAIKYSDITAKRQGAGKGKFKFFVPPSAEDFAGLLYNFLGKGKQGEKDMQFFNKVLIDPYWKGVKEIDAARQTLKKDFKYLSNAFPNVSKKLNKAIPNDHFTYDQAARVYLWEKEGKEIPGLSSTDKKRLVRLVNNDVELKKFADGLEHINPRNTGWVEPSEFWETKTVISELYELTEKAGRQELLKTFIDNSNVIFSPENLNKIEALYGSNMKEAFEDMLHKMKTGTNRAVGSGRIVNAWTNWVNSSTGVIMFMNTKSAILQTLGAVNYLNLSDNNPFAAAKAFANFPQYAKDFSTIINSDQMRERREGLKGDVAASEIANAAATSKNKAAAIQAYLLKIGFTPTQAADAFAVAVGGASFYRNRINTYKSEMIDKNGQSIRRYTDDKAEKMAWRDFIKTTEETQQSSDPALISQQQATVLGRMVLAFNNAGMQYDRLIKKSFRDLKNGRGDAKTNIGKIIYYGAIQNLFFTTLQKALFATMFDDDEEDGEELTPSQKKKKEEQKAKEESKTFKLLNDMGDTVLRGTGLTGAVLTVVKNTIREYVKQRDKDHGDQAKTLLQMLNISPPIGSKVSKVYSAINIAKYDKDVIAKMGASVTIDGKLNPSPIYSIGGKLTAAATNLPTDRIVSKVNNISEALDNRNSALQRVASMLGWSPYDLDIKNEEQDQLKDEAKTEKKKEDFKLSKEDVRALPLEERKEYLRGKMKKRIEDRKAKLKEKREELKKRKKLYE